MKNSKIILAFACAFSTFYTFSQGTNWRIAGNNNITGGTNFLGTTNAQPIEFRTSNVERMRITSNGFVGLNNSVPNFHLDIITPERPGGELLFRTRVSGDEVASMNIINIAGASNTFFVPALFGLQSNTVAGSAFNTIGSIDNVQDLSNLPPISRFFSARDYNPALNNYSLDRVNVIKNRPLFQWLNGTDGLMIMNANGFVGLATATPGNRLEINSDYYNTTTENVIIPGSASDTTFATDNGFGGTGYSGLRFTNLRSSSIPQTTNPGQGVLALDENGDVIYVPAGVEGQDGINGLNSLIITTNVPVGDPNCPTGGVLVNVGIDDNNDGVLQNSEMDNQEYVCNGLNGTNGVNGADGAQGPVGPAGSVNGAHNGTSLSSFDDTKVAFGQDSWSVNGPAQLLSDRYIPMKGNDIIFHNGENDLHGLSASNRDGMGFLLNPQFIDRPKVAVVDADLIVANGSNDDEASIEGIQREARLVIMGDRHNVNAFDQSGSIGYQEQTAPNPPYTPLDYITSTLALRTDGRDDNGWDISSTNFSSFGGDLLFRRKTQNSTSTFARFDVNGNFIFGAPSESSRFRVNCRVLIDPNQTNQIGTNSMLEVNGISFLNGDITGTGSDSHTSDSIFKINIDTIGNSLQIVKNLKPKKYYFDTLNQFKLNFNKKLQFGFVAQDVENILPSLVDSVHKAVLFDSVGNIIAPAINFKTLNYNGFIAILTDAIQEQQTQIDEHEKHIASKDSTITAQQNQINDLNTRLSQLENCLSALLPILCTMNQEAIQQNSEEQQKQMEKVHDKSTSRTSEQTNHSTIETFLSDRNAIILSQNVPNPFAEMTIIKYNIPTTIKEAQIHFYTANGIIINSVRIVDRGNGEIRVFAQDLSSGLYTYSLVADGKVVATKKMVKE